MDGAASQGNVELAPPSLLPVPFLPLFPWCATATGNKGEAELALVFPGSEGKQHYKSIIPVGFPSCHFS